VLVFSENITSRLLFTLDFIFKEYLHISYEITSDRQKFIYSHDVKICYGTTRLKDAFFIYAENLLSETTIHTIDVRVKETDDIPILFPVNNKTSDFPFDIFSAIFYLLSRYEEYVFKYAVGQYRFPANQSIAYRYHFLNKPIIHIWIEKLAFALKRQFPSFSFTFPQYNFLLSFDIDNAYAYRHKNWWRTAGATIKSLLLLKIDDSFERWLSILNIKKDKYDSYAYIERVLPTEIKSVWFFLLGNYGKFDKNISYKNRALRRLISDLSQKYQVGIHPSFASNNNKKLLTDEIHRLQQITGKPVIQSRQHFLRMKLPDTYRNLADNGIQEDYSMGYAEEFGFRAGTSQPFYFFDLEKNMCTKLKIFPFQIMDVTMRRYKKYSIEKSKQVLNTLIDTTRIYHGNFISLWHNESLGTDKYWNGWRALFEWMIIKAAKK